MDKVKHTLRITSSTCSLTSPGPLVLLVNTSPFTETLVTYWLLRNGFPVLKSQFHPLPSWWHCFRIRKNMEAFKLELTHHPHALSPYPIIPFPFHSATAPFQNQGESSPCASNTKLSNSCSCASSVILFVFCTFTISLSEVSFPLTMGNLNFLLAYRQLFFTPSCLSYRTVFPFPRSFHFSKTSIYTVSTHFSFPLFPSLTKITVCYLAFILLGFFSSCLWPFYMTLFQEALGLTDSWCFFLFSLGIFFATPRALVSELGGPQPWHLLGALTQSWHLLGALTKHSLVSGHCVIHCEKAVLCGHKGYLLLGGPPNTGSCVSLGGHHSHFQRSCFFCYHIPLYSKVLSWGWGQFLWYLRKSWG